MANAIDLTTTDAVRRFMQKQSSDAHQDEIIGELITRASRAIMTHIALDIRPQQDAAEKTFVYRGGRRLNLAPYVLRSVDSIEWDSNTDSPTTLESSQYSLRPMPARDGVYRWLRVPYAGDARYGPTYPGARGAAETEVTITGDWGYEAVPADVEHWCIVTVTEWLRLHVQAFSTVLSIDTGQLERPEALPSAVRAGLGHYRAVSAP